MAANKTSDSKIRRLKVSYNIQDRGTGIYSARHYTVVFPQIRLLGKWLQDCGFTPGAYVTVLTAPNKLTIEVITDNGTLKS
ncbi:hypothetical protein A8C56_17385 [Niabella ginsenosidivorans]|uniref:Toxin SymE-like domain-containing protein n=1 Tax=Niabella ginsenosidivorans TaxID=1176587 RepID=A0A1A9I4A7_9BACT|nr:SymE family type I addiction module toxin [Niabella ginsenosidivorans]ANH82508.1 hypothetical protein A8C56_17385 [Niabella ginsenosidivorans]